MPDSKTGFPTAYDEDVRAFSPPSAAAQSLACQLLIAGGGLSGLSAAEAAMRRGLDVIVIEKGEFGKEAASGLNAGQFLTGWVKPVHTMIAELARQEQERGARGARALRLAQLNHDYNLRASLHHGAAIAAVTEADLADLRASYEFMQASNLGAMMPSVPGPRRPFFRVLSARAFQKRCGTAEDVYA